tara:strand:+ start:1334 stop:1783 length:450 start_codon:yes stop_codon:yes gene_type:complete
VIKIFVFIICVLFDLFTKFLIQNYLFLNQSIKINQFFDIVYVQNYGVSFGLFSREIPHWVLVLIALLVVILILYLMIISNKNLEKNAYFLIIAGAIGNIIDRILNSYVVDFISLHYEMFYWPAFNFADIYITIGIIMLLVSFFIKSEDK